MLIRDVSLQSNNTLTTDTMANYNLIQKLIKNETPVKCYNGDSWIILDFAFMHQYEKLKKYDTTGWMTEEKFEEIKEKMHLFGHFAYTLLIAVKNIESGETQVFTDDEEGINVNQQ